MRQINDWREALKSVLNELGIIEGEEIKSLEKRLEWMPLENPELDLPPLVGMIRNFLKACNFVEIDIFALISQTGKKWWKVCKDKMRSKAQSEEDFRPFFDG